MRDLIDLVKAGCMVSSCDRKEGHPHGFQGLPSEDHSMSPCRRLLFVRLLAFPKKRNLTSKKSRRSFEMPQVSGS